MTGLLGSGGLGSVYRARDKTLGRDVAIKLLHVSDGFGEATARLTREGVILARLRHPNLVEIYDADMTAQPPYLVLELLSGCTLAERVADHGPLPEEQVRSLAAQVADSLAYIHGLGIVHRDVKPANVFIEEDASFRLMDLGLALPLDGTPLTEQGAIVGTVRYLSPEALRGEELGPWSDVYQFGLLLHHALTGRHRFETDELRGIPLMRALARSHFTVPSLSPTLPPDLASLIEACTALDPQQRPADGEALVAGLHAYAVPSVRDDGEAHQHREREAPRHRFSHYVAAFFFGFVLTLLLLARNGPGVVIDEQGAQADVAEMQAVVPRHEGKEIELVARRGQQLVVLDGKARVTCYRGAFRRGETPRVRWSWQAPTDEWQGLWLGWLAARQLLFVASGTGARAGMLQLQYLTVEGDQPTLSWSQVVEDETFGDIIVADMGSLSVESYLVTSTKAAGLAIRRVRKSGLELLGRVAGQFFSSRTRMLNRAQIAYVATEGPVPAVHAITLARGTARRCLRGSPRHRFVPLALAPTGGLFILVGEREASPSAEASPSPYGLLRLDEKRRDVLPLDSRDWCHELGPREYCCDLGALLPQAVFVQDELLMLRVSGNRGLELLAIPCTFPLALRTCHQFPALTIAKRPQLIDTGRESVAVITETQVIEVTIDGRRTNYDAAQALLPCSTGYLYLPALTGGWQ